MPVLKTLAEAYLQEELGLPRYPNSIALAEVSFQKAGSVLEKELNESFAAKRDRITASHNHLEPLLIELRCPKTLERLRMAHSCEKLITSFLSELGDNFDATIEKTEGYSDKLHAVIKRAPGMHVIKNAAAILKEIHTETSALQHIQRFLKHIDPNKVYNLSYQDLETLGL